MDTRHDIERFLMFAMLVAGKRSDVQRRKLNDFLTQSVIAGDTVLVPDGTPLDWVRDLEDAGLLEAACRKHRLGKYRTLVPGFRELAAGVVDPVDTDFEELQKISGIGPKTARFFLSRTDSSARVAVLDTHVLAFLDDLGVDDVPDETPRPGPEYRRLEQAFLDAADARGLAPAALDARVWAARTVSTLSDDDVKAMKQTTDHE